MTRTTAILALLERATRRFQNFRTMGIKAKKEEVNIELDPMSLWEPADEALLKEMHMVLNQHGGLEPLPLEAAATADDEEAMNE